MKTLISLLQDRDVLVKEIADRVDLKRKFSDLNGLAAASFAIYGAIIGSQHSFKQALSSSVCRGIPLVPRLVPGE